MQQNLYDTNDQVISALRAENDKQRNFIDTLEKAIKILEQRLEAAMEQLSSTVAHVNTLQSRIRKMSLSVRVEDLV